MSDDKKILFVEWCAQDALGGTLQMEPMTELAYRRIMDMIYASDDALIDDDVVLQYSTKTGAKWKAIKKQLIDIHKKIYVENGFIKNRKCTEKLEKSWANISQKSEAGKVSAEKRKALKNNKPVSTAVATPVPTSVPTNQEPNNQYPIKEERKRPPKKSGVVFVRPDWIPEQPWQAFCEHRKKIKKPMSEDAMVLTVKELDKLRQQACSPEEVLNQSIQRGWAGVFEIRGVNGNETTIGRSTNSHSGTGYKNQPNKQQRLEAVIRDERAKLGFVAE